VTSDPLFTDVNTNNYTLRSTSPAINTGTDLGYTEDFAGTVIPSTPDMGAYEYTGGVVPTPPSAPTNLRIVP
jgi:hypothetical protein